MNVRHGKVLVIAMLGVVGVVTFWATRSKSVRSNRAPAAAVFAPTVPNPSGAPGSAPKDMVWIPGGEFSMGAQDPPGMDDVGMKATKSDQDQLDACICLVSALHLAKGRDALFVGCCATGYIVVPDSEMLRNELERRCVELGRESASWVRVFRLPAAAAAARDT